MMPFFDYSTLSESSDETNHDSNIQVLVCTANIGNEPPNLESMSEWIPKDGETNSVLQSQEYPLKASEKKESAPSALCDKPEDPTGNIDITNAASDDDKFDIIVIGMQEATFEVAEEWAKASTSNLNYKEINFDCHTDKDDTHFFHQMLSGILPSYTRDVSYQRGQMRLIIFHKKDLTSFNLLSVKAQNTGKGGRDNKGGIVAECEVGPGTRISFLTAHLEAHEGLEKYNTRCSTIADIFSGTASELANSCCDVSVTSHFTFVMGDLNFRTRLPNYEIGSEEHIKAAHKLAEQRDWDTINKHDELVRALTNRECLYGFKTPRCDFPPTFKIERKNGYAYKSNRSPSYTDRILYKANHNLSNKIKLKAYGPVDRFTTSDHKPVRGSFKIQLNPKISFQKSSSYPEDYYQCFGVVPISDLWKNITAFGATIMGSSNSLKLSCSSIECVIETAAISNSSYTPSLSASFMTTPNDAIEAAECNTNWMNFWGIDNILDPSTINWPHTETISNTLTAQWKKQVEFTIRPYSEIGVPLDLTGALLHVVVHDAKDNSKPFGSCSLNLASLLIECIEKSTIENNEGTIETNVKNVEETLTKNGKEIGSIKLNIETQWR